MPVTLAKLATNTAQVTIKIDDDGDGGDSVTITYYPGRVTEAALSKLEALRTLDESSLQAGFSAFNEELAHLIKEWDVLEDDGVTMFPLDGARFAELPLGFRAMVYNAILSDIRPETVAPQVMNGAH